MSARRDYDADQAAQALGGRLTDWGVQDAGAKARAFIDEMQRQGWKCRNEQSTRQPPRRHEECPQHPGEYRLSCRGCGADKRAQRDQVAAEREQHQQQTRDEAIARARADIAAAQAEQQRLWAEPEQQEATP